MTEGGAPAEAVPLCQGQRGGRRPGEMGQRGADVFRAAAELSVSIRRYALVLMKKNRQAARGQGTD